MSLNVLNRKIHYWGSILIAIPLLIVVCTGILLQVRKQVSWVQPTENKGKGKEPSIAMNQVLESCQKIPEVEVKSWSDISRVDIRPAKGILKVTTKNGMEVQIDFQTGEVLQVAIRRSDVIQSIHEGAWFHESVKIWIFLPSAIILLILWLTGMILFWRPFIVKRRQSRSKIANDSI